MPETSFINIIIQGGAVGIAALAIWVIYKMQNGQSKALISQMEQNRITFAQIAESHKAALDRNTDAWIENTRVTQILSERINHLTK